jgi:hypothetical protein
VDGELAALVLEQDAWDFNRCEGALRRGRVPRDWDQEVPPFDIEPVNEWFMQRNLLGSDYDRRFFVVREQTSEEDEPTDSANAIEIISHIPLALIAIPAYTASLLTPVGMLIKWSDKRWAEKSTRWANAARQVYPGSTTEEELRELMGRALYRRERHNGMEWQYERGYGPPGASTFHFGLRDGLVVYKEITGEMDEWTVYGQRSPSIRMEPIPDCDGLRAPWQNTP